MLLASMDTALERRWKHPCGLESMLLKECFTLVLDEIFRSRGWHGAGYCKRWMKPGDLTRWFDFFPVPKEIEPR